MFFLFRQFISCLRKYENYDILIVFFSNIREEIIWFGKLCMI